MTEAIKAGDRVTHYKHGRGIVLRLVSRGLVEVRFEQTVEYVEQRNLKSIDRIKRVAQVKRERDHEEQKCALKNHVLSLLEKNEYATAHSLYQNQCRDWWPINEYDAFVSHAKKQQSRKAAEEAYLKQVEEQRVAILHEFRRRIEANTPNRNGSKKLPDDQQITAISPAHGQHLQGTTPSVHAHAGRTQLLPSDGWKPRLKHTLGKFMSDDQFNINDVGVLVVDDKGLVTIDRVKLPTTPVDDAIEQIKLFTQVDNDHDVSEQLFTFLSQHDIYKDLLGCFNHCPSYNSAYFSYCVSFEDIKARTINYGLSEEKRSRLLDELKERIHAYRLKITYDLCDASIKKREIVAYTHMMRGFNTPEYNINDLCTIEIKTNFGYGSASYFFIRLKYRSFDILPYSEWVEFRIAKQFEVIRYWKCYELKNQSWTTALNDCAKAINLSVLDTNAFLDEYVLSELEILVAGLEGILAGRTYYKPDGTRLYSDNNEYLERGHITTRGEKISGALRFVKDISQLSEYIAVQSFIKRIEACNAMLLPTLKSEVILLDKEIINKDKQCEPLRLIEAELKPRYDYFSDVINCVVRMCNAFNVVWHNTINEEMGKIHPDFTTIREKYEQNKRELQPLESEYNSLIHLKSKVQSCVDTIESYFSAKESVKASTGTWTPPGS